MDRYKFRGRRLDNGEWVYGSLITCAWKSYIKDCADKTTNPKRITDKTADFRCVEVDPATIGQFTGLCDKNGKEIYEGDVLKYSQDSHTVIGVVKFGEIETPVKNIAHIGFYIDWQSDGVNDWHYWWRSDLPYWCNDEKVDIAGSIHDDPELLEVQDEHI